MKQREKTQGNEHVVENGNDGGGSVHPLKPEGNIYQHAGQSIESGEDGLAAQLGADGGTDDFDVANGELAEDETAFKRREHRGSGAVHTFQIVEIGEDAAVVAITGVEQALCQLVVSVAGVGAEHERILLREVSGERVFGDRIEINFSGGVRGAESFVEHVEDRLLVGVERGFVLALAREADDYVILRAGIQHSVADGLDGAIGEAGGGEAFADLIDGGRTSEANINQ